MGLPSVAGVAETAIIQVAYAHDRALRVTAYHPHHCQSLLCTSQQQAVFADVGLDLLLEQTPDTRIWHPFFLSVAPWFSVFVLEKVLVHSD